MKHKDLLVSTTETSDFNIIDINDKAVNIFTCIATGVLCQAVAIFGIVTNIINIMCFVKQGFREAINISLVALAVSDLGCLVTQIYINTSYTLYFGAVECDFDIMEVSFLVGGLPHIAFSRVNSWITAIITMERCLCVTVPLKIKDIITSRRVCLITVCVYVIFIFSGTPIFVVNKLGWKFSSAKNRTLLGIVPTADKDKVEGITFAFNSFLLPFIAFIVVIVCTAILVVNLRQKTKWRKSVTQTDLSKREQKVAKMVVMISSLFIFCFVPVCIFMLAIAFEPRLGVSGKYVNISSILCCVGLLLESINSSVNIFIYYHMSRKYRDTFKLMFYSYKYIQSHLQPVVSLI